MKTPLNNMRKLDKEQAEYKYKKIEVGRMEKKLNTPRYYITFINVCL